MDVMELRRGLMMAMANTGGGLPAWIEEMDVQDFSPSQDTSAEKTFTLNMQETPDLIVIYSDIVEKENVRDYCGGVYFTGIGGITLDNPTTYRGYGMYATVSDLKADTASPTATNQTGVLSASNTAFTIKTPYYGGSNCYWKASHTYKIIAIKVKSIA